MLTTKELAGEWRIATVQLLTLTSARFDQQQAVSDAKRICEEARAGVILSHAEDPKALGANEATREARIKELCAEAYGGLQAVEIEAAKIDHDLALVRIRLDELKFYRDLHDIEVRALAGAA